MANLKKISKTEREYLKEIDYLAWVRTVCAVLMVLLWGLHLMGIT